MWIIPYTRHTFQKQHITVHAIQILTVGGTALWKEDDGLRIEEDILEPNGLCLAAKPVRWKDAYLCPIDSANTAMSDFYKWTELDAGDRETFCWRTFYILKGKNGLPVPEKECIGPFRCQELLQRVDLNP